MEYGTINVLKGHKGRDKPALAGAFYIKNYYKKLLFVHKMAKMASQ